MRVNFRIASVLACGLLATPVLADPAPPPPKQGFSGEVALGWIDVRGNTRNSTFNLKGELDYDTGPWHHSLVGQAISASSNGSNTAEAYMLKGKSKWDFTPIYYAFGGIEFDKDRYSAYEHQLFETAGLGWHVFKTPVHELNLEGGIGLTQSKFVVPDAAGKTSANGVIGIAAAEYLWHISENATFSEKAQALVGGDNTLLTSNTELKATIVGNLSLALGYLLKYNTTVPNPNIKKADSLTSIGLAYKF
jgi:putative salt-induced outer membrane protein